MEQARVEHSMGVLCKSKGRYLLYMGRGGKIWRLPKGHFETKDTYNVVPYKDLKVRIIEKHYEYPMGEGPGLIIAGVRELAEQCGFILPCDYLRNILQERYREQGELRLIRGNEILAAQQPAYKFFSRREGVEIDKRITFFLAELKEQEPVLKTKDKYLWVTQEELKKMAAEGTFDSDLLPVIEALEAADQPVAPTSQ